MQPRPATAPRSPDLERRTRSFAERSLAAAHPSALYRPVPPVALDADGYPYADSAVSESASHDRLREYFGYAVRVRFAQTSGVTVGSDLIVLFEEGNSRAVLSPDLFVAFGRTAGGVDQSYKVWEEGAVPAFALEILSASTWRKDAGPKRRLYEALGVGEYWIIDPIGRLPTPITGLRLAADGRYEDIGAAPTGGLPSDVLGLEFVMRDGECRLRDPDTGEIVRTYADSEEARLTAEQAHRRERLARQAAEARIAELEARLRDAGER